MSLRTKSLYTVAVLLAGLLTALYATSQWVVMAGFAKLEAEEARQDMQRILSALEDEIATIEATTRDWAVWDDTYAFIDDANESYRDSTLADGSFANNNLNLMLYIHGSGRLVFGKAYDLNEQREVSLPESVLQHVAPSDLLVTHTDPQHGVSGILSLPEGTMLVSSQPILTSQGEGPVRGALIFGRYFDSNEIERLARTTLFSLQAFSRAGAGLPPDVRHAADLLSDDQPLAVRGNSSGSMHGFAQVKDVYGNPALILEAEFPRNVYRQGRATVVLFMVSAALIGLSFAVAVLVLLERLVLSRLFHLDRVVGEIGQSQDLNTRVPQSGRDELGRLGQRMNGMLQSLKDSREDQERAQADLRATNDRLADALVRLERAPEMVRQERVRALGEMASGIAHDFKNALVPISGLSELLLVQPKLLEQKDLASQYLKVINAAARDASSIVERLREFYLTGEDSASLKPMSLNEVVKQTIALTEPKWKPHPDAGGSSIGMVTALGDIPPIQGSEAELREAVTNLIFNAVDAMPRGGTITIGTSHQGDAVRLALSDTGTGMTEEVRRRCMEPFFTTKGEQGTGLGLAMVYGVVKRHGGAIDIQTAPGKGTTFVLSFQAHREPAPGADPPGELP